MSGAILTRRASALARIKALVLDALPSPESKRAYGQALDDFFRGCEAEAIEGFTKASVNAYRVNFEARGLSASTINQRLSAIRKLAVEAADNRSGQWLTREQAERLIAIPDPQSLRGKRDRALLAVLIGCGLRRAEAANLCLDHIQLRDARWVIIDLIGKGRRVRTVPMPSWTKHAIDAWQATASACPSSPLMISGAPSPSWHTKAERRWNRSN